MDGGADATNSQNSIFCRLLNSRFTSNWDVVLIGQLGLYIDGCAFYSDCADAPTTSVCQGLGLAGIAGPCQLKNVTVNMVRSTAATVETQGIGMMDESGAAINAVLLDNMKVRVDSGARLGDRDSDWHCRRQWQV